MPCKASVGKKVHFMYLVEAFVLLYVFSSLSGGLEFFEGNGRGGG